MAVLLVLGGAVAVVAMTHKAPNHAVAAAAQTAAVATAASSAAPVPVTPSPTSTPAPPTPTAAPHTPTPRPAPTATPKPQARQCSASDFNVHAAAIHMGNSQSQYGNSPIAHPGDDIDIEGYFSFSSASGGCQMPAAVERVVVLDPSGHMVTWFSGMTRSIPAATGATPNGCGCGPSTGPGIVRASVIWMCTSSTACSTAPLGDYTLVATLTTDSGKQILRVANTVPVQAAS